MTYLELLSWARKGIRAEQKNLREMQEKALEAAGARSDARSLADHFQAQIDALDVKMETVEELQDIHDRK